MIPDLLSSLKSLKPVDNSQRSTGALTQNDRLNERNQTTEPAQADNTPEFKEVLREATELKKEPQNDRQKKRSLENVSKKIQIIEEKIAVLKENPQLTEISNLNIEKLEDLLKKIKLILKNTQNKAGLNNGLAVQTIDDNFLKLLELLAKQIDELTNGASANPDTQFDQFARLIEQIDTKLSEFNFSGSENGALAELGSNDNANITVSVSKPIKDVGFNKSEKVKVVDLRTKNKTQRVVINIENSGANKIKVSKIIESVDTNINGGVRVVSSEVDIIQTNTLETPLRNDVIQKYESFASSVTRADIEALMQSVTGKAVIVLKNGKSEMKLNLSPPELGKMSLKFTLEDGVLMGKIVVSTPEAKMLFDKNLGELQRMLQQAGVNVSSLDVSLGNNTTGQDEQADVSNVQSGGDFTGDTDEMNIDELTSLSSLYESSVNYIV